MRILVRSASHWMAAVAVLVASEGASTADPGRPAAAEGWSVEPVPIPAGGAPTAVATGAGDTVFLGRTTQASASVLAFENGRWRVYIDGLQTVNGLESIGDALFVAHPPFLSAFRDADGDGRAERRFDLISGLGAPTDGPRWDVHSGGGIRRGADGFLYLAVGDRGVPRGVGADGATIRMASGGVVRVRPDGTGLEVVSTGDDQTTALMLSAGDDVFSFGGGDDRKRWAKSLVHHIATGRYGYPYQFLNAAFRTLPVVSKLGDGRAGQGVCYNEGSLPASYDGGLIVCDPSAQTVHRLEIRKVGGSFTLSRRTPLASKGGLDDFRPYALAIQADGLGFWLVDQGSTGRLHRLTYHGPDRRPTPPVDADRIKALDHPALSVRLAAEDELAGEGAAAVARLADRLGRAEPAVGRIHALWALDRIGTADARAAIRSALVDPSAPIRLQAARSCGVRRDREAGAELARLVHDRDPAVRREAATALGRIGDRAASAALLAALDDADRCAAWSIRQALLAVGCDDRKALVDAFVDPRRREPALLLADESWSAPILSALVDAIPKTPEAVVRGRMITCLAGQYRRCPEWSGDWFGPDPLAAGFPRKTEPWTAEGAALVMRGLTLGVKDADASVRYQAILGLQSVGVPAAGLVREAFQVEPDADNQAALADALGALNDAASTRLLLPVVVDPKRDEAVRASALDSLNRLRGRDVVRARLTVLYDAAAPASLAARALPALARDGFLPPNDLAGFLENPSPLVRAAAVVSFNPSRPLPPDVRRAVLDRLDDSDADVRRAAMLAAGPLKLEEAVPRLIEKAADAQGEDRAAVVHALCSLPDPRGLEVYLKTLDDPDPSLDRAGVQALSAIRDQVEPALREARRSERRPEPALALDRVLARFEPIREWRVVGPLPNQAVGLLARDGSIDLARVFPGAEGASVGWKLHRPPDGSARVDLLLPLGESNPSTASGRSASGGAAAAYAELTSPEARRAFVLIRSTGATALFVNGVPIDAAPAARDFLVVNLAAGLNRLLVTSRPGPADWSFDCLVSSPDAPAARPD